MNKMEYIRVITAACLLFSTTAFAEQTTEKNGIPADAPALANQKKAVVENDADQQETANAITAVLHGKNPETLSPASPAPRVNERESEVAVAEPTEKTQEEDLHEMGNVKSLTKASDELPPMKHFMIRGNGEYAYNMDCFIKGADVLCKGSLSKQPANFKSYESTLIGKISGSVIKGNVTSYIKTVAGADKSCATENETNWPMTITLSSNQEALMDTGPVKSYINSTGDANCSGASEQTYPGKKIAMKWRAIG